MQIKDISSVLFLGVGFISYASAGVIEGNPTRSLHVRAPAQMKSERNFNFGHGSGRNGQGSNNGQNQQKAKTTSAKNGSTQTKTTSAAASTNTVNTQNNGNNNNNNNNNGGGNAGSATLDANAVQTGSASTGQNPPVAGQSNSLTDTANFINFCSGKTLTNGIQVKGGSCNGIVMGEIPASTQMVSSLILNPPPGGNIAANTDFNIQVAMSNLAAGSFTNAAATYYSAPQKLNAQGLIIGHTHVTVQDMGNSFTPGKPLDPSVFAFFKGINDAGSGGVLTAVVAGGLPAGNYRVCTMSSASNHQPVLMPVAQRGAQDDCNKFTVGGAATGTASGAASGNNSGSTGTKNTGSATSSAVAASSSAAVNNNNSGKQTTTTGKNGRGGRGRNGRKNRNKNRN